MVLLSPLLVCVILSGLGFMGSKKHVILVLLILEYLSVFMIYEVLWHPNTREVPLRENFDRGRQKQVW